MFWRSKAEYLQAGNLKELCNKLTEFSRDRWVVAWQLFKDTSKCEAVVTYKIKE